jgi:hypothetical protein
VEAIKVKARIATMEGRNTWYLVGQLQGLNNSVLRKMHIFTVLGFTASI